MSELSQEEREAVNARMEGGRNVWAVCEFCKDGCERCGSGFFLVCASKESLDDEVRRRVEGMARHHLENDAPGSDFVQIRRGRGWVRVERSELLQSLGVPSREVKDG